MTRRATVNTTSFTSTGKVTGQTVYLVASCVTPACGVILRIPEEDLDTASIACPACGAHNDAVSFAIGSRWKFCIRCERIKPLADFHRHARLRSGHQGECRECKTRINSTLNPLRTSEQHRESSEGRRLFGLLAGERRVSRDELVATFKGKCFKCEKVLDAADPGQVDHTLPVKFLWPSAFGATLLCRDCNNQKHDRWPSDVYSERQLRDLAVRTGIDYDLLAGPAVMNPAGVAELVARIDEILIDVAPYPNRIRRVRRLVFEMTGTDILQSATHRPAWASADPD